LGYGAATACGMPFFRKPFEDQLASFAEFLPYPDANDAAASSRLENIERTIRRHPRLSSMGAILVEPMQGRGGERAPPAPFLPLLRRLANDLGFLLICDEIYTGFFRTGKWFACEHSGVVPDLICLGKAMSGGYPISACVGTSETMDAWPKSNGEALHTSTFLGNPVGCALAVRSIQEWRQPDWSERIVSLGQQWLGALRSMDTDQAGIREIRGQGLSIGVELSDSQDCGALTRVGRAVVESLKQGIILLGGGIEGDVITLSPNVKAGTVEIDWVTGRLEAILLAEQFRF
jgi:4-aminobutyrate aminotransferase-like enzyme